MKFHHVCQQDIGFLTDAEAEAVIGKDRESNQRDLYESIERGDFPRWKLYVQIMPEADAATVPYHPFDFTKVWPHADYPLIEVGEWELNRNPNNYFAEMGPASRRRSRILHKAIPASGGNRPGSRVAAPAPSAGGPCAYP